MENSRRQGQKKSKPRRKKVVCEAIFPEENSPDLYNEAFLFLNSINFFDEK